MNKTISINLSGQVYQVDEPAYEKLKAYLEAVRKRYAASEGGQEIIADIESRIGEMFSERVNSRKAVITQDDVDEVTRIMGKPEEFETEETEDIFGEEKKKLSRRLFRNPDEKVVSGVCSGISAYLGVEDPLWIRLIFIVSLLFSFGTTLFIYIVMVLIVPDAKTASEKLQMRGEDINISNIEKTIKEDLQDLKTRIENINAKPGVEQAKNIFEKIIGLLVEIVLFFFRFIGKLLAVVLIIGGTSVLIALAVAGLFPSMMDGILLSALYPLIFSSKLLLFLAGSGLILLIGIPALSLVFAGFHLLLPSSKRIKGLGISMFGLWLVGFGLVIFTGIKTALDFRLTESIQQEIPLAQPANDTIYLSLPAQDKLNKNFTIQLFDNGVFIPQNGKYIVLERVRLEIKKSPTDEFQLTQVIRARGQNTGAAQQRIENVSYLLEQNDSLLMIQEYFSFPSSENFRGQEIRLVLYVPEDKSVFIDENLSELLYRVQNTNNVRSLQMAGRIWTMQADGLSCIGCDFAASNTASSFKKGKVSREFSLEDFNTVKASGVFNLEIKQGANWQVTGNGSQSFVDALMIKKINERLEISYEGSKKISLKERGTVTVVMPSINGLTLHGANNAVINGFDENSFSLEVSGAGDVEMNVNTKELKAEVSGASKLRLKGKGANLNVVVAGASSLRGFEYLVENATINATGASKAEVYVTRKLNADAAGASEILYKGLPEISTEVSGFSSVKPER